jgi:hypothetical protein
LAEQNCTGNKTTPRHDKKVDTGPKESELDSDEAALKMICKSHSFRAIDADQVSACFVVRLSRECQMLVASAKCDRDENTESAVTCDVIKLTKLLKPSN